MRDQIIDYIHYWRDRAEVPATRLVEQIGIAESKYFQWRARYGKAHERNAGVRRDQ